MNVHQEFLSPDQCLLLLIDLQKSMLDLCVDRGRTVSNTGALIEVARVFNIPVLFTTQNPDKLGGFLPELTGMISSPQVLGKMEFNCFEREEIARAIRRSGRRTLLLAGIEGHICIFHSTVGALRLGYRVHIARDAISSRSEPDCLTGIERMERAGAVISSTEMIIFELLHRAGTDEFRTLLPLLKRLQPIPAGDS
ncbi:MAG: isochorismatase family protein [Syntrophobacteraceae bacterium]